jgi:KaiC/GvpD/RAD55 family RecA-like ATPase
MLGLPVLLRVSLEERLFTLIFGPPGSGKTLLASHLALEAARLGLRVVYIHVGSHNAPRWPVEGVSAQEAVTLDDLVSKVAAAHLRGAFIIVDPINEFYTSEAAHGAFRGLSFAAALLRKSGGVATGVVREFEGSMVTPAWEALHSYAHIIAEVYKHQGRFRVRFLKPYRRIASFAVDERGLRWL